MFNRTINQGTGTNNRSGDTLQAICALINDLIVEHNSASSYLVNVFRYIPPAEWPAIQARTSTYDCHSAVMAAINSRVSGSGSNAPGASVSFPDGKYLFSAPLNLKRTSSLIGPSSGLTGGYAVELSFAAGVTGIIVNRHDTNLFDIDVSTTGADGALISGLFLTGAGYASDTPEAHGIVMRARAKCVGVTCRDFKGDGFRVQASAVGAIGDERGNANLFHLENCTGTKNWGNGLFVNGADANAGNVIAFNGTNNGRWGIWDSSFLGNTYLGCHSATNSQRGQVFHNGGRYYLIDDGAGGATEPGTNSAVWVYLNDSGIHTTYPQWVSGNSYITGGAYKTDSDSARNVFIGCYSEGGQAPASLIAPTIVSGGLHAAGYLAGTTAFILDGRKFSGFDVDSNPLGTTAFLTSLSALADEAITVKTTGDHVNGLALLSWDSTSGDWITRHARLLGRTSVRYTTDLSTFQGGRPSPVGAGNVVFPKGAFISDRMLSYGNNPPTAGEAGRGDMVFNKQAASGQPSYWQCTTAGVNGAGAVWTAGPVLP